MDQFTINVNLFPGFQAYRGNAESNLRTERLHVFLITDATKVKLHSVNANASWSVEMTDDLSDLEIQDGHLKSLIVVSLDIRLAHV